MKKLTIMLAVCLMLGGCGTKTEVQNEQYVLDTLSIPQNTQTIKEILDKNVWNYDEESMSFGNDPVLSERGENFPAICEASEAAGISTKRFKRGAKQTMLASVKLLNSDMSDAGTAYFAFNKQDILCGYYVYNNVCLSLTNKYPFEYASPFKGAENKEAVRDFTPTKQSLAFDAVEDIYGGETAVLSGSALIFYANGANGLKRSETLRFDEGLMPVSVSLGDKYSAVLLDSYEIADTDENDYEISEDGPDFVNQKSEKIVFVDSEGDTAAADIPLELSIYSCVAQLSDGSVAAARNNAIDIFARGEDGWEKSKRLSVDAAVEKLRIADIDGSGSEEYIISDGVNIYVYTNDDDRLKLAWRTKFGVSAVKDFFAADVNGDGVKELYVNDSNGFVTRYTLGIKGFEVYGGGITGGENAYYAAGDTNGDGSEEYLAIADENMLLYE